MTLRAAHELGFALSMICGLLGVLLGGEMPAWCWLALIAVPVSHVLSLRERPLPVPWGTALAAIFFGLAAWQVALGGMGAALHAACIALIGCLCARLLTRYWPSHDLQALALSLALMFAGTLVHQAVTYGLVLVAYTIVVTWALLTRQLVTGCVEAYFRHGVKSVLTASLARRDVVSAQFFVTVALLATLILASTAVLFVLFPRVGLHAVSFSQHGARMPGAILLTDAPRASGDDEVVARVMGVTSRDVDAGLYLRGRVYDVVGPTGFGQAEGLKDVRPSRLNLATAGVPLDYTLLAQPIDGDLLLALGPVLHASDMEGATDGSGASGQPTAATPLGELRSLSPIAGPYRVRLRGYVVPLRAGLTGGQASRAEQTRLDFDDAVFADHFLRLPGDLDPRIAPLAQHIAADAVGWVAQAARLRAFLSQNFTYDLQQVNAQRKDPLAGFLFADRRGHCEYFAVAYAVLLRCLGIPSRVVGGYQGGTWDADSSLVTFGSNNAHAWVEWYLPGHGWVVDDATPPSDALTLTGFALWRSRLRAGWDGGVLGFGLSRQLDLFKQVTQALTGAGGASPGASTTASAGRFATWKRYALIAIAAAAAMAGVAWAASRLRVRRQGPALQRALEQALERIMGAPLPRHKGLVELTKLALADLPANLQPYGELLVAAAATYQRRRFDPRPQRGSTQSLCRKLRRIPKVRPRARSAGYA